MLLLDADELVDVGQVLVQPGVMQGDEEGGGVQDTECIDKVSTEGGVNILNSVFAITCQYSGSMNLRVAYLPVR